MGVIIVPQTLPADYPARLGYYMRNMAATGKRDELHFLIQQDRNLLNERSTNGKTSLHWAIERGHPTTVFELLANGAAYNIKDVAGKTPIDIALLQGNALIHHLLIQHMIKNYLGSEEKNLARALRVVADAGDQEAVKLFCNGSDVDINEQGPTSGQTALHRAVIKGEQSIVEFLLNDTRINPQIKDNNGRTPEDYIGDNEALKTVFLSVDVNQLSL